MMSLKIAPSQDARSGGGLSLAGIHDMYDTCGLKRVTNGFWESDWWFGRWGWS